MTTYRHNYLFVVKVLELQLAGPEFEASSSILLYIHSLHGLSSKLLESVCIYFQKHILAAKIHYYIMINVMSDLGLCVQLLALKINVNNKWKKYVKNSWVTLLIPILSNANFSIKSSQSRFSFKFLDVWYSTPS